MAEPTTLRNNQITRYLRLIFTTKTDVSFLPCTIILRLHRAEPCDAAHFFTPSTQKNYPDELDQNSPLQTTHRSVAIRSPKSAYSLL